MKLDGAYLDDLLSRLNGAIGKNMPLEGDAQALEADSAMRRKQQAVSSPADDSEHERPSLRHPIVLDQRQAEESKDDSSPAAVSEFWPLAPNSFEEMKLAPTAIEELALKCLANRGTASGREIGDQIAVPFGLLTDVLQELKTSRLVVHRGAAQLGDYVYQLSETGIKAAARYASTCAYDGAAPVSLQDYIESVYAQSIHRHPPTFDELSQIFGDLVLSEDTLEQVGQAIRAGYGFFLYGDSGNGKTSVAERVSRAFGKSIWIPRTLVVDGMIIRLFDPCNHVEVPVASQEGVYDRQKIDGRWVRIRRPTILVGGELTMDRLEIRQTNAAGINEAPLQMKSNGGTLVIDDFGRQRMRADELLNRWIVPLDRRYDFLNLPNGKTIQVPFDQLLIFSTNMPPHKLADEAFLRRIPYKIRAVDPTEAQFRELLKREAERLGVLYNEAAVNELIQTHYIGAGRPFRGCHPRDLLRQVKHYCKFKQVPVEMTVDRFSTAVRNYFAVME